MNDKDVPGITNEALVTKTEPYIDALGRYVARRPGNDGGSLLSVVADPHEAEQKSAFLAALYELHGNVYQAGLRCGVYRATLYRWRSRDDGFKEAWDQVIEATADDLESELTRRAYAEKGMPGVVATLALLKRYRPDQYAEERRAQTQINVDARTLSVNGDRGLSLLADAIQQLAESNARADDTDGT